MLIPIKRAMLVRLPSALGRGTGGVSCSAVAGATDFEWGMTVPWPDDKSKIDNVQSTTAKLAAQLRRNSTHVFIQYEDNGSGAMMRSHAAAAFSARAWRSVSWQR